MIEPSEITRDPRQTFRDDFWERFQAVNNKIRALSDQISSPGDCEDLSEEALDLFQRFCRLRDDIESDPELVWLYQGDADWERSHQQYLESMLQHDLPVDPRAHEFMRSNRVLWAKLYRLEDQDAIIEAYQRGYRTLDEFEREAAQLQQDLEVL